MKLKRCFIFTHTQIGSKNSAYSLPGMKIFKYILWKLSFINVVYCKCLTRGPPNCVMCLAVTFGNYVYD